MNTPAANALLEQIDENLNVLEDAVMGVERQFGWKGAADRQGRVLIAELVAKYRARSDRFTALVDRFAKVATLDTPDA